MTSPEPERRRMPVLQGDALSAPDAPRRSVEFRDPEDPAPRAEALKADIARILTGAEALPHAIGRTRILRVDVSKDALALVVALEDPIAQVRAVRGPRRGTEPGETTLTRADQVPAAARFGHEIEGLLKTLRSLPADAWTQAWDLADRVRELPLGVPLAFYRQLVEGARMPTGSVRTGFRCNQDCGLCWQSRAWGGHGREQILAWIEDLHRAGAVTLVISGGEPTLDPSLAEYVAHARRIGIDSVSLETNAIRFARGDLAAQLRDAGLTDAFVSLHSPREAVSDAITRAPGTWARTVEGVSRLLEAGLLVTFNAVMTSLAVGTLAELPDFIASRFAPRERIRGLMLSYPSDPWDRTLLDALLPDPDVMRSALRAAADRAESVGLAITGLDGPCGPPLCAFDADRRLASLEPVAPISFRRKIPACDGCAVSGACFGVRPADLTKFGDRAVRPLRAG